MSRLTISSRTGSKQSVDKGNVTVAAAPPDDAGLLAERLPLELYSLMSSRRLKMLDDRDMQRSQRQLAAVKPSGQNSRSGSGRQIASSTGALTVDVVELTATDAAAGSNGSHPIDGTDVVVNGGGLASPLSVVSEESLHSADGLTAVHAQQQAGSSSPVADEATHGIGAGAAHSMERLESYDSTMLTQELQDHDDNVASASRNLSSSLSRLPSREPVRRSMSELPEITLAAERDHNTNLARVSNGDGHQRSAGSADAAAGSSLRSRHGRVISPHEYLRRYNTERRRPAADFKRQECPVM